MWYAFALGCVSEMVKGEEEEGEGRGEGGDEDGEGDLVGYMREVRLRELSLAGVRVVKEREKEGREGVRTVISGIESKRNLCCPLLILSKKKNKKKY